MKLPRAAVIVLNWSRLVDTLECVEWLAGLDYPAYDVVVVDNSSTDGSVPAIRERFSLVTMPNKLGESAAPEGTTWG